MLRRTEQSRADIWQKGTLCGVCGNLATIGPHSLDAVSFWRMEKYNHSPLAGLCESKHCRLSYWLLSIVYRKWLTPRHIDLWIIGKALFLVKLVSCSAPGTRMNHQVAEDTNLPGSGIHRCSASRQYIIHLFLLIILNTVNPSICP